jgi:hypothetical protein
MRPVPHLHLTPPLPHRWRGVSWHGLWRYLRDDWRARHRHRQPCGCLIENVALYGHRSGCPNNPGVDLA